MDIPVTLTNPGRPGQDHGAPAGAPAAVPGQDQGAPATAPAGAPGELHGLPLWSPGGQPPPRPADPSNHQAEHPAEHQAEPQAHTRPRPAGSPRGRGRRLGTAARLAAFHAVVLAVVLGAVVVALVHEFSSSYEAPAERGLVAESRSLASQPLPAGASLQGVAAAYFKSHEVPSGTVIAIRDLTGHFVATGNWAAAFLGDATVQSALAHPGTSSHAFATTIAGRNV